MRDIVPLICLFYLTGCFTLSGLSPEEERRISDAGAAIGKPIPNAGVIVPSSDVFREKQFDDQKLISIVPLLDKIDHFDYLDLENSSVGDRGVRELVHVKKLKFLNLKGTNVTAKGLLPLKGCPSLERIGIDDGKFSGAEMEEVKRALGPRVTIDFR